MKGVILAGNSGDRLYPLTKGVPKQLLPLYNKPMIYYPLDLLVNMGVRDILIITTSAEQQSFRNYLGDGSDFAANISYAVQDLPEGIAQALIIAESFIGKDSICLTTGDTLLFGDEIKRVIRNAINGVDKSGKAAIIVSHDTYEDQYGVVVSNSDNTVSIQGKPLDTGRYYSITGMYFYPNKAINLAKQLTPSDRGLLEITELNEIFHKQDKLQVEYLNTYCTWLDTNTFDNLLWASNYVARNTQR